MNCNFASPAFGPGLKADLSVSVILAIMVFCSFGPVIHCTFINVDDDMYVYKNPVVMRGLTWEGTVWAFTRSHAANWHPLTWLSHMLDCRLFGLRPGGHHCTNVLLHAASAILLFLILRRMTGRMWLCAFVAGLFAVHPLRVESVAWVAERKDVLSGFFFMLTMGAYLRYAASPGPARYTVVMICFAMGLMAKPMMVTMPFVLLLLDYWPLRRVAGAGHRLSGANASPAGADLRGPPPFPETGVRRLCAEKIPLLMLVAASSILTIWAQRQVGAIKTSTDLELPWRLANAAVSYVVYIGKMIFPHGLAAYYPHPGHGLPLLQIVGAVLALAVITTAVVFLGRRFPYLPVGWFWYLGMLVPVIGLVQVGAQGHADRYTYLPQIGLYIMVVWGMADVFKTWPRAAKRTVAIAGAVCLVILMACTWHQTGYWKDPEVLWKHALACNPGSSWINKTLGDALRDKGRLDEAIVYYRQGARISPEYAGLRLNLGNALYRKSLLAEARQELEAALQADSTMDDARISLGVVLYLQGKAGQATNLFRAVLARDSLNIAAHNDLGVVLENLGRTDEAITHYRQALRIDPAFTDASRNLGRVLNATPVPGPTNAGF